MRKYKHNLELAEGTGSCSYREEKKVHIKATYRAQHENAPHTDGVREFDAYREYGRIVIARERVEIKETAYEKEPNR